MKMHYLFLLPLLMLSMGCGGAAPNSKRDPVFPASGTVKFKGQPVVGADITFTVEGGKRSAFARTDSKGAFRLTTYSPNDGAVAGKHAITVSKTPPSTVTKHIPIESKEYVPPDVDAPADPVVSVDPGIPAKYSTANTSELMCVVEKGAKNEFNLELTE